MESKEFFNRFYQKNSDRIFSKSLLDFFETIVRPRLPEKSNILEIGSGTYSLFEEIKNLNAEVTAIDFAKNAIALAPQSSINYFESSVVDTKFFSPDKYDLVFDSHCMNCITDESERKTAFQNIFRSLKPDGYFAGEFMVQSINKQVQMPFKLIRKADDLEKEIQSFGFKIIYFMISRDNIFGTKVGDEEVTCDVLRMIAKKVRA